MSTKVTISTTITLLNNVLSDEVTIIIFMVVFCVTGIGRCCLFILRFV